MFTFQMNNWKTDIRYASHNIPENGLFKWEDTSALSLLFDNMTHPVHVVEIRNGKGIEERNPPLIKESGPWTFPGS